MPAETFKTDLAKRICEEYRGSTCELDYSNEFELLVAVILSAQCTDKRVNQVTKNLFKVLKTPKDFAEVNKVKLEELIRPCGFYHAKAKNLIDCAKDIVARFNGVVPSDKKALKSLAGVGEKTANVMLATAFNTPAIAVDTHVFRVSRRLGLAKGKTVGEVQTCLEKLPKELWANTHFSLVLHGRRVCKARKPMCENCKFSNDCKYNKELKKKNKEKI
ncbi:MAG: endonuclease III [bacterium]|nr:endonuclease III [bacterium]